MEIAVLFRENKRMKTEERMKIEHTSPLSEIAPFSDTVIDRKFSSGNLHNEAIKSLR